jgi:hypothetical protein
MSQIFFFWSYTVNGNLDLLKYSPSPSFLTVIHLKKFVFFCVKTPFKNLFLCRYAGDETNRLFLLSYTKKSLFYHYFWSSFSLSVQFPGWKLLASILWILLYCPLVSIFFSYWKGRHHTHGFSFEGIRSFPSGSF